MPRTKHFLLLAACVAALFVVVYLTLPRPVHAFTTGIVGWSGNPLTNSGLNCNACHAGGSAPTVTLSGPTSVQPGETALYTLTIAGGQATAGGFNVSAAAGAISKVPGDGTTRTEVEPGTGRIEITHSTPQDVNASDEVIFQLRWTAPATPGAVTLYGSGNSVDLANGPGGDQATSTTLDVTVESAGTAVGPLYFSLDGSGTLFGIPYGPEDVLVYDAAGPSLALHFDGSDVGLAGNNVDALDILPNGRLILSLGTAVSLPGAGMVQPSDLVQFTPTSTGNNTSGTFLLAFDGSDVGLDGPDENIDGFTLTGANAGWLSTSGSASVPGATANDVDLLLFTASSIGPVTAGTWSVALVGDELTAGSSEDIDGVWADGPDVYLSTLGAYTISGPGSGDGNDIFICRAQNSGPVTDCTYDAALYADASQAGVMQSVDAFTIVPTTGRAVSFDVTP